ncbi:sugar/nucleoside kinase (ribokinase family) [Tamaricihabitans halophyticus]|uniref:Sugar/nucleoside kinase (Ribokinase family) n=1 Tax=Tamaricihabitans halophyticus TaxID=1262583 RepID=A0A4R2QSI3_9PSEU|nr:PfkB family carbohydrate kinase [Tamaricihabitans halophyticus]TCP50011.1 sugar/nucleoside kinase (ribokinase family) [Tamaricihabitans halophyticus]
MSKLVHTGQAIIDLVMRVPAIPAAGSDVLAAGSTLVVGGGFNVMVAARRSGAVVHYAGEHGTGYFGDRVREALHEAGILLAHPPTDASDTGFCVALVDDTGERTFVTSPGAEGTLRRDRLDAVSPGAADIVYVSGYSLLHEANRSALLDWLPGLAGPRVLLDPGPLGARAPGLGEVLPLVHILSCNATEAHELSERGDTTEATAALVDRLAPGASVVVRDGAKGCLLGAGGEVHAVPGFPVDAVDTNGAGDAHTGVLAADLLRGIDIHTAALRANAAASLAVREHGPATAPSRAAIDDLLRDQHPSSRNL